jgi:catechol 2,3-dioxygenase-like lactoylglutathione lyase family enzyme
MDISLTHIALHVADLDACCQFYQSYAGMQLVHERASHGKHVIWLAHPGREHDFILVILPGGPGRNQAANDFSHLGFAVASKREVDDIAQRAASDGILEWEPKQEPYPVGYYCGVRDPDGNFVEFSYGQPLGPGSEPGPLAR